MADTNKIPKVIVDLFEAKKNEIEAGKTLKAIRELAEPYLRDFDFSKVGVKLTRHIREGFNPEQAKDYLDKLLKEGKITKSVYESFFVMVIDQSAFENQIIKGVLTKDPKEAKKCSKYLVPEEVYKIKIEERLTFDWQEFENWKKTEQKKQR